MLKYLCKIRSGIMKKGFTIVELMASIVIIGIISLLGVATYRNVSKKIKNQQYKNS